MHLARNIQNLSKKKRKMLQRETEQHFILWNKTECVEDANSLYVYS